MLMILFVAVTVAGVSGQSSDTYRLITSLMSNYSKDIRPVVRSSQSIVVRYGVAIQQIIDLDEVNQIITTNVWLRQHWSDWNLRWEPNEYGGIRKLTLPSTDIWKPDIILYNNADDTFEGIMKTNAEISYDGSVTWNAPAIFKSSCKIAINYFPFDVQRCTLQFGSWAYTTQHLNLMNRSAAGDRSNFIINGEWRLEAFPVIRTLYQYACCQYPFSILDFVITIRRRSLFYVLNMLVPCILVSALTLLSFYLPADAAEKITLCITILLSLTVFLLLAAETMPPTSEVVPLISKYYIATVVLVSVSTLFTVIVLYINHRGTYTGRAPSWLRRLTLHYLARLMWMKGCDDDEDNLKEIPRISFENASAMDKGVSDQGRYSGAPLELDVANLERDVLPIDNNDVCADRRGRIHSLVNEIADNLQEITERSEAEVLDEAIKEEWVRIAFVVDRLFMWIFGLTTVLATCSILFQVDE
ncbi:neuronal acetylcholine receptor subunit alpha-3-like [Diadema antillarum]|uniref:neuronal acetylcholine receptor subunit alpha-3-like n=1 Tax=Diadema antillarum TaxID=105358 RepID=UPI003A86704E